MAKQGAGRPRAITPGVADTICERLAIGRTLADVARDEDLPSRDTIYEALRRNPDFAQALAVARAQSAYGLAESVVQIADDATLADNPQWVRNRCYQRRWLAAKYNAVFADNAKSETTVTVGLEQMLLEIHRRRLEVPIVEHEQDDGAT